MKTPITYYGGKQNLTSELTKLIPNHVQYCEAFVGGGAFLFAKQKSKHEAINDYDSRITNFWEVIQNNFEDFYKMLHKKRLHSEKYYNEAKYILNNQNNYDNVSIAWAFWYGTQVSFGSQILNGFAFDNRGSSVKRIQNKIDNFSDEIRKRIQTVEIFTRDAIDFIILKDNENTFFYFDPPYINSDCGHYENKKEVYHRLIELLPKLKSKWMLSSFENELTLELRKNYNSKTKIFPLRVDSTRSETKYKTELLVWNYEVETNLFSTLN